MRSVPLLQWDFIISSASLRKHADWDGQRRASWEEPNGGRPRAKEQCYSISLEINDWAYYVILTWCEFVFVKCFWHLWSFDEDLSNDVSQSRNKTIHSAAPISVYFHSKLNNLIEISAYWNSSWYCIKLRSLLQCKFKGFSYLPHFYHLPVKYTSRMARKTNNTHLPLNKLRGLRDDSHAKM